MSWDAGCHEVGTIVKGPKLRTLDSGATVANFTIEARPRHYDKEAGEWRDVKPVRLRCNAWHDMGHHVAASLQKGDRVIVMGRLKNNDYTDETGVMRNFLECDVDMVGPDLRYVTVQVNR